MRNVRSMEGPWKNLNTFTKENIRVDIMRDV